MKVASSRPQDHSQIAVCDMGMDLGRMRLHNQKIEVYFHTSCIVFLRPPNNVMICENWEHQKRKSNTFDELIVILNLMGSLL